MFPAFMHLRLSDQDLCTLVEMLSLAANVASWNQKPGAAEGINAYEDFESRILEKPDAPASANGSNSTRNAQRFRVKKEVEEQAFYTECYDEFRNENFWSELAIRLADRDLAKAIGLAEWEKLSEEERRARTTSIEKRYWDEFTKHGINRVVVMAPPGEG